MTKIENSKAAVRVLSIDEIGSVNGAHRWGGVILPDKTARLSEAYQASHPQTFGSAIKDDIAALGR